MISPNSAKVNLPKVNFTVNTFNEVKYNIIYLYGDYLENRYYNKKNRLCRSYNNYKYQKFIFSNK